MDTETCVRELTTAFLNAQRERILEKLSESLKQSGSTALLPIHYALFDLMTAYVREPSHRRLVADVHRILAGADSRPDIQSLISGQTVLWTVLHRMLREVEGPHSVADVIHAILVLTGNTVDGVIGVLVDVAQSRDTSVEFPGWRTRVEVGRTFREFHTLKQVTYDLLDARDPAQMYEILEEGILGAFHLRSLAVAAVNHQEGFVEVVRAYPTSPGARDPVGWRFDLSHPDILCEVARTGRIEVIDGWDPRYHERVVQADGSVAFRQRPTYYNAGHTAFFVPILAGDRVIGVVCTGSTQASKDIVLREIERMRPFLHQVGATLSTVSEVIERKRAEEALKQTISSLNALVGVARTLTSTLNLDALLNHLVHRLVEVIPTADLGAIFLYDPETQMLVPAACLGFDNEAFRQIRLLPGEAITGKTFQTGRSVLTKTQEEVDNLRGGFYPENARLFSLACGGLPIQSNLCIPLCTPTGEVIGTLNIESRRTAFNEDDLSLLEGVAAEVVLAVQNARLFEQVRAGREQLQTLSHRLLEAQEEERRRIARELHDEVGQALTAVKINLQALQRLPDASTLALNLKESIDVVERATQQVRDLSLDLRPSLLDDLGLAAALRWYVDRQAQRVGFTARLVIDPIAIRLSPAVETACFRIAQEALTNVARHAQARRVRVELRQCDAEVRLVIRDDGLGFDVDAVLRHAAGGASMGLLGMRERVLLAGGQIEIDTAPGQGTEVRARFPLKRET